MMSVSDLNLDHVHVSLPRTRHAYYPLGHERIQISVTQPPAANSTAAPTTVDFQMRAVIVRNFQPVRQSPP